MERYADWLERLPASERRLIVNAPGPVARLDAIRRIRERQWVGRQALAVRKSLKRSAMAPALHASTAGLMGPILGPAPFLGVTASLIKTSRGVMLAQLRQRERERHREWRAAFQSWDELTKRRPPLTLAMLKQSNPDVHTFVEEYLRPRLSNADLQRLNEAADQPSVFPRILVELADKHPSALPGSQGPTHFSELPKAVQQQLAPLVERLSKLPPKAAPRLRQLKIFLDRSAGKWPQYGKAIAMVARMRKIRLAFELWPSQESDLSFDVQKLLRDQLYPELSKDEKKALEEKKTWPEFPLKIEELAKKHKLRVPWLSLPGSRERWGLYRDKPAPVRASLPDLPRHTLRQFAALELTERDRARLGLAASDTESWERLKAEYFKRKPQELRKLKQAEMNEKSGKKNK
jgi:hypothetical protein